MTFTEDQGRGPNPIVYSIRLWIEKNIRDEMERVKDLPMP
jgi:hypothetical protein